jgi:hypothetical protein
MTTADPVTQIAELFASEGAAEYLGEPVTQAAHMLQAAQLAERDGADDALIAADLLHDVGHFTGTISGQQLMEGTDNRHSHRGADWLARWFGPEVTEPVRLHWPPSDTLRGRSGLCEPALADVGLHPSGPGRPDARDRTQRLRDQPLCRGCLPAPALGRCG